MMLIDYYILNFMLTHALTNVLAMLLMMMHPTAVRRYTEDQNYSDPPYGLSVFLCCLLTAVVQAGLIAIATAFAANGITWLFLYAVMGLMWTLTWFILEAALHWHTDGTRTLLTGTRAAPPNRNINPVPSVYAQPNSGLLVTASGTGNNGIRAIGGSSSGNGITVSRPGAALMVTGGSIPPRDRVLPPFKPVPSARTIIRLPPPAPPPKVEEPKK